MPCPGGVQTITLGGKQLASLACVMCLGSWAAPLTFIESRGLISAASDAIAQQQNAELLQERAHDGLEAHASKNTKTKPEPRKHFQDVYVAKNNPTELEFGHVFENLNNWEQRFEKLNLENLNRQGKIRWGDKNGGYGEHYWDYNHAGNAKDEENEGEQGETQNGSENSQANIAQEGTQQESSNVAVNQQFPVTRTKRNPDEDIEFINDEAKSAVLDSRAPKHGGNYRRAKQSRPKRHP